MSNIVILVGRMGSDVDVDCFETSKKFKFLVVTNEYYKDKNGNKKNIAHFHNCYMWSPGGDIVNKYFAKGKPIMVTGSLENRMYEKDGQKKKFTAVKVSSVNFVPNEKPKENSGYQKQENSHPSDNWGNPWGGDIEEPPF